MPDSRKISRASRYLGARPAVLNVEYGTFTLCGYPFQGILLSLTDLVWRVLQPHVHVTERGLGCSRFARRYSGNNICSLFHRLLRCFSSAGSRRTGYEFTCRHSKKEWVAPFGNLGITVCLVTPPSISPPTAPFIGLISQGIHCVHE